MKIRLSHLVALVLCASLLTALAVTRANDSSAPAPSPGSYPAPGQKFAESISMVTGVAISPLLGASGVGCYQWVMAKTPENRAKLPWFAQPMFFVPALVLVGACFLKDSAGTALPTALKKPLDIAEAIEHKVSGLVATGAFVPYVSSLMADASGPSSMFNTMGMAAADTSWLYNILMTPIMMVAFFIVFLASNAINALILLSPFTTVDAALKTFRTAILGTVCASAWINPWIGAAWAIFIILFSWLIAGWSFRLSHFGLVFIWDFCTFRSRRFSPDPKVNKVFLWRKVNKVPARTYGHLQRDEKGNLVLTYRPWLVLPARTLVFPEGQYAVGKAVFYQALQRVEGEDSQNLVLLPPRYRGHEEELVKIYNLTGVREAGLRRAWKWIKELFTGKPQPMPA